MVCRVTRPPDFTASSPRSAQWFAARRARSSLDAGSPADTGTALRELVAALLEVRTWTAFDVDESGRVLAGHDELGSVQLVEIAPDGTRTPLTNLSGKCSGRYVPGSRQVVVQHDQGGDENMQLSLLDLDALPAEPTANDDLTPLVRDAAAMHVLHDVTETAVVYSTNRRNGVDMDVVVRNLSDGTERTAYEGGGYVVDVTVSHDTRSAAVTRLSLRPASTVVDVARSDGVQPVTEPDEHAVHHHVHWSADDKALVLTSNRDREFVAVHQVPLDGAPWRVLVEDAQHDLSCWVSPDGSAMVVGTMVDGAVSLAVHEADGTPRCAVEQAEPGVPEVVWAADSTRFVLTATSPTEPGVIGVVDASTGRSELVASSAAEMDAALHLQAPTVHRVPTPDGEQVPCYLYAGSRDGDPALVGASVLHVHGGPEAAADQVFNPVIQALAAIGLTVLVPNVRGSTGYGKRWYSLDDVELRLDSVADLAALHDWLPSQRLDPKRSALWGGSYGGYMVLAGVSMQPTLWAAGVDIVGISSLVTFLENTSGYRRAFREREYGSLEHHREFLQRASPITYLSDIIAPLFVIHGANDPRVPLSEAEQIKAALDDKGVPCELRVYGDEGHGLANRANKLDAYPAALDFLRRHLAVG